MKAKYSIEKAYLMIRHLSFISSILSGVMIRVFIA